MCGNRSNDKKKKKNDDGVNDIRLHKIGVITPTND
jgi:hypothetical protein